MKLTLGQLADCCNGQLQGSGSVSLDGVSNLREADQNKISLYSDKHYLSELSQTRAAAIITSSALAADVEGNKLVVDNPLLALAQVMSAFQALEGVEPAKICDSARVASSASIGAGVDIGTNAVVGPNVKLGDGVRIGAATVIERDVEIGQHTRIDANVTIYHGCILGERCHVSSGAVIGADGFGFAEAKGEDGPYWVAIPQTARVMIGNDVHIGANATIDRGSLEDTVIGDDVIIDNLVQIAHNVVIGKHTALAGCAGVAGSTRIGENCKIGGRASILGHIEICDNAVVFAVSYVTKSITKPGIYSAAMPAMPLRQWQKTLARFRRGAAK